MEARKNTEVCHHKGACASANSPRRCLVSVHLHTLMSLKAGGTSCLQEAEKLASDLKTALGDLSCCSSEPCDATDTSSAHGKHPARAPDATQRQVAGTPTPESSVHHRLCQQLQVQTPIVASAPASSISSDRPPEHGHLKHLSCLVHHGVFRASLRLCQGLPLSGLEHALTVLCDSGRKGHAQLC